MTSVMVESLQFYNTFLKFEDLNDNQKPDEGEVVILDADETEYQFVYRAEVDGFHVLKPLNQSLASSPMGPIANVRDLEAPIFVFSEKLGFLFHNKDPNGKLIFIATGQNPFDVSSYSAMTYSNFRSLQGEFENMPALPPVGIVNEYFDINYQMAERLRSVLGSDSKFLASIGVKSVKEMYESVQILTEGQIGATESQDITQQHMFVFAKKAFAITFPTSKPMTVFYTDFLQKCFDAKHTKEEQRKWDHALRSIAFHEWQHTVDIFPNSKWENSDEFPDPIYHQIDKAASGRASPMFGNQVMQLYTNNITYKFGYDLFQPFGDEEFANKAVFFDAINESKAYIAQMVQMSKVGLDNYPKEFLENIKSSAMTYFDLCLALGVLDGGQEYLRELFQPLKNNEDITNYFLSDWDQYSAYYDYRLKGFRAILGSQNQDEVLKMIVR